MKRLVFLAAVSAISLAVSAATPWTGKKVAFLGDSITDPAQTNRPQRIYWQYLAEDLGLEPHGYAVSGYQWDRVYKAAQKMQQEMGGEVDAIVIFAGTNDYMNGIPLGEWYDVAEEEVYLKGKTLKAALLCYGRPGTPLLFIRSVEILDGYQCLSIQNLFF